MSITVTKWDGASQQEALLLFPYVHKHSKGGWMGLEYSLRRDGGLHGPSMKIDRK